jgi:hypothetical protein
MHAGSQKQEGMIGGLNGGNSPKRKTEADPKVNLR